MKYFREKALRLRASLSQAFAALHVKPSGRILRGLRTSLCLSLALLVPLVTIASVCADSIPFAPVPYPFTDSLSRETSQVPDGMLPDSYTVLDKAGTDVLLNQSPGGGPDNDWVNGSLGALSALPDDMTGIAFYYDLTASTNTGQNHPYESNFCVLVDGKRISLYNQMRLTNHFRVSSGAYVKETRNEWNARFAAQTSGYCVLSITKAELGSLLTANGVASGSNMIFAADEYSWNYGRDLANSVAKARDFGVLRGDSAMAELEEVYTTARNQSLNYVVANPGLYSRSGTGSGIGSVVKETADGIPVSWNNIKTGLNESTVRQNAQAVVVFYDTTGYSSTTDISFQNAGLYYYDMTLPAYAANADQAARGYSSLYGVSETKDSIGSGTLGEPLVTDSANSYKLPAKGYGYKIIPVSAFQNTGNGYNTVESLNHYDLSGQSSNVSSADKLYIGGIGYVLDLEAFKAKLNTELAASKARIEDAKAKIDAIGQVTVDSEAAIRAARAAYDALDASVLPAYGKSPEKNLVGEDRGKTLEMAEKMFQVISGQSEALEDVRHAVDTINAIGAVTKTSEADILTALEVYFRLDAYAGLEDILREMVTNATVLTAALDTYVKLCGSADAERLMDSVADPVTLNDRAKFVLTRKIYESVSAQDKLTFTRYEELLTLEEAMDRLTGPLKSSSNFSNVLMQIENLDQVFENSDHTLNRAFASYLNLDAASKRKVSTYRDLLLAQVSYERLFDVAGALSQIAGVGTVNSASGTVILAALESYLALGDSQKSKISNYATLQQAIETYAGLLGKSGVETVIMALPNPVSLSDRPAVEFARRLAVALPDDSKVDPTVVDILNRRTTEISLKARPSYYLNGNYTVIGHNDNADTRYGDLNPWKGVSESPPSLYGDFGAIPENAEALVFAFDFSESTDTGKYRALNAMQLIAGNADVWTIAAKSGANRMPLKFYEYGEFGFVETFSDSQGSFVPTPGAIGYCVIPLSGEYWDTYGPKDIDWSEITEVRFYNEEYAYGADLANTTVRLRDLGYIRNLEAFTIAIEEHYLPAYTVRVQPDSGAIKLSTNTVEANSVEVSWTAYPGAYGYYVGVYNASGRFITNTLVRGETTLRVGPLAMSTDYRIQVAAVNKERNALSYSNVVSFKTSAEDAKPYEKGTLPSDGVKTRGYLIEGTSVTLFWEWISGVSYYEAHLYEVIDGKEKFVGGMRSPRGVGEITFLLLGRGKQYVLQLVSYDPTDSAIFVYDADRFTLSSASTYKPMADTENPKEDEEEPQNDGDYVQEPGGDTDGGAIGVVDPEAGEKPVVSPVITDPGGKWKNIYEYVLDWSVLWIYISIGVVVLGAGITLLILFTKKKKKKIIGAVSINESDVN